MYQGKIIATSMTFRHFPLTEAMRQIQRKGFDEMEITIAGKFTPHFLHLADMTEYEMKTKAAEAAEAGIHVYALNIGNEMTAGVDGDTAYRTHLNALRLAYFYGAKIVTFGCERIPEGSDTVAGLQEIGRYFDLFSQLAWNEYNIQLSVEAPHRATISEKFEQIQTYWAYMPKRLKCTLDIAHVVSFSGASVKQVLGIVGDRLAHVHLRDAIPGNSMIPYGKGAIDFAEVFRLLDEIGYQGKCSLEFPSGPKMDEATADLENGINVLNLKR